MRTAPLAISIASILILAGCEGMQNLNLNQLRSQAESFSRIVEQPNQIGEIDFYEAKEIGTELLKAASLDDHEVRQIAKQVARHSDSSNNVPPGSNRYAKRLTRLTKKHLRDRKLKLNFKVYLSDEVNAFALADGSIRLYSGLMDEMTDQELLSVIGHEIGHVRLGHSKKALQVAFTSSAAKKGASVSFDSGVAALGTKHISDLAESLIRAQFSQAQEIEADDFGLTFMKRNGYNPDAATSALLKLAELGGEHNMLSTHPDPLDRARRLEERREEEAELMTMRELTER